MGVERFAVVEPEPKRNKLLIAATAFYPPDIRQQIKNNQSHRIGELLLEEEEGGASIYDYRHRPSFLGKIDERLKLDFGWAFRLVPEILRRQPKTVLCLSERIGIPLGMLWPSLKSSLSKDCKLMVVNHHPLAEKKSRLLDKTDAHKTWDMTMVVSQGLRTAYSQRFDIPREKVAVLPVAIDTQFYCPSPNESGIDIGSIGVNQRDYETLIKTLRNLPEIVCRINPTSPWDKASPHLADLPSNVQAQYDYTPPTVRRFTQNSRFMVAPLDFKKLCPAGITAVLLAGACGKAIIATKTPAIEEYVVNGETGILIPDHDPLALEKAIRFLWENPETARQMGRKARAYVAQNFSIEKWLENIKKILG